MNINIELPKPHPKQRQILDAHAKRTVICAGRRGGKTELVASLKAIPHFLNGGRVVYGAPVAEQTNVFWETICKRLQPLIDTGYVYRNKTERYVEWAKGKEGRIKAKTAYDADTWRGDWGDLLIYDEYAYTKPNAWEVVGAPMLLDNDGEAWFISTPNRKNHFHALYVRGNDDLDPRWQSFHFTSFDNPHLSKDALRDITQDMTEDMIQQEIMAQFLDNAGAVFRRIGECLVPPSTPDEHIGHALYAGVDWGKHQDYTVISIGCLDCKREVYLDRFNKIDYAFQRERLAAALDMWGKNIPVLPERNSIGEPNIEMLERDGVLIMNGPDGRPGFGTTSTTKKPLIEGLVRVIERGEWGFIDNRIATAELEAYEVTINPVTHHVSYSAPAGVHDDTVIGRALNVWAAHSYMPAFL